MASAGSHGIARTIRKRTEEQRQQDLDKIKKYQGLELEIRDLARQQNFADPTLFDLTTKLLRLNPEYYTIWNVRRRCLISGSLSKQSAGSWPSKASPNTSASATTKPLSEDSLPSSSDATPPDPKSQEPTRSGQSGSVHDQGAEGDDQSTQKAAAALQSELQFTIPLLLEFPKCYWIWNHRSYILHLCIAHLPLGIARDIWTAELGLISKMLNKDQRNFHAWSYRRKVVAKLESAELHGQSMAESEFEYTTKKIKSDLSNFSAWHSRSQLALRVLDERGADDAARKRFLESELDLAREGLNVGPEDQSLWYYHQFLMSHLLDSAGSRSTMAPNLTKEERVAYAEKEIEEITDLLEDYDDIKWIYEALLEYSIALDVLKKGPDASTSKESPGDEILTWLAKLKQLDPLRGGRWQDVEESL